jgi:hypothetical protein
MLRGVHRGRVIEVALKRSFPHAELLALATLFAFPACACNGDGDHSANDAAPTADAQLDAGVDPRSVRVTVLKTDRSGEPDASARVLFLDPSGAVIDDR